MGRLNIGQCQHTFLGEENGINNSFDIIVTKGGLQYSYGIRQGFLDTTIVVNPSPGPGLGTILNFITSDLDKRGWTCDENDFTYSAGKGITKRALSSSAQETYLGTLPPTMQCQGGLTYRRGKFYLHSIANQLVEVNMKDPSKSKVVMDFPPGILPIDALTTVQVGCDSSITYAIGRTPNNSKVYEINFNDWTLTELCDFPISIVGAGAQTECMLPPCPIFLDLDSDNSSFAFRGDYCADTFCVPPVAVADTDVVIVSSFADIASITLELVGWLDAGQEYLSAGVANNIIVIGNNSTLLTLENNGSATIADFEEAISAVLYHNDAVTATFGKRMVMATAFAGGESSLVSIAELPLSNEQMATQATTTDPTCHGFSDGSILVSTTGGVSPYTYQWAPNLSGDFIENLPAGSYLLTTTDSLGCSRPDTFQLEEPDSLVASILYTGPPTLCDSSGQLSGTATGGSGQLSYLWGNGVADSLNTNIGAGSHTLTVQDNNGCTATASIGIPTGDTVFVVQNEAICEGSVFIWNGTDYFTDTLVCLVFSMANGCDSTACLSLVVNPVPGASVDVEGDLCSQAAVTLSAGQQDGYLWSTNEDTPAITVADPGSYVVTVTNAFGCTSSATAVVSPAIAFEVFSGNPSCPGDEDGFIQIENISGGVPPYRYSMDGGNQFFPESIFENLPPGNYLLIVEDAGGCREEMAVLLEAPTPITLDAGPDREINFGESIVLTATTNVPNPVITWSPPDYLDCAGCPETAARPLATIQYEVEVTDSNGCTATDRVSITVNNPPSSTYAPTAFSPNGDGFNDYFTVFTDRSVSEILSLRIFDRWGGLVFEKRSFAPNAVAEGWDGLVKGKPVAGGTYVFVAELLKVDGQLEVLSGELVLVR